MILTGSPSSEQSERKISSRPSKYEFTQKICLRLLTMAFFAVQLQLCAVVNATPNGFILQPNLIEDEGNGLNDDASSQLLDEVKRSWRNLRRSIAKPSNTDDYDTQSDCLTISTLNGNDDIKHPESLRYSVIYAPSPNDLAEVLSDVSSTSNKESRTDVDADTLFNLEKKNWKNMNVAWGKRRSAVWNKFRGAWGKREAGWNNLKGMWGKRSPGDWKKLQSAWGKR